MLANPNMIQSIDGDMVDIDDVTVDVLIVCKNPAAFQQSATFLSRRGWPTTIVGSLSKAIEFIVKYNPDFILISCNHPNPNIIRLPIIVEQTEGSTCIAFAEVNDAVSSARLNNSPVKHKIQGLPSGPNIQRLIRKLLIEGDGRQPLFHTADAEEAALNREINGESPAPKKVGRRALKEILGRGKKVTEKKKELLELSKESEVNRGESGMIFLPTKAAEIDPNDADFIAEAAGPESADDIEQMKNATIDEGGDDATEPESLQPDPLLTQSQVTTAAGISQFGGASDMGHMHSKGEENSKVPSVFVEDPIVPTTNHRTSKDFHGSEGRRKYLSLLEKSIEQTLTKLCPDQDKRATPMSSINEMGVIPLNSVGLHGYLIVCGAGKITEFHKEFVNAVKISLKKALLNNGYDMSVEDPLYLNIEMFNFVSWSKLESELAYTANHKGIEIGIGFLSTPKQLSGVPVRGRSDMAKIQPEDIVPNRHVPFKAYLHFKKSNKFYLYLRNGRILYEDQLQRLTDKKVEEIYIKTIDVKNFRYYSSSYFIAASITRSKLAKAS